VQKCDVKGGVLMEFKGKSTCFVCGNTINWVSLIADGTTTTLGLKNYETFAELIASGTVDTPEGPKTKYEVIVECKKCRNRNRFTALAV